MIIRVASLTLRFYVRDGWTEEKVRALLRDPKMEVTYRGDVIFQENAYYAVYENSGHKVFDMEKILEHEFVNPFNNDIGWYYY